MNGGTLRVIWIGDVARRVISIDAKTRQHAITIARAIFDGAEERPNRAEWQEDNTSEVFDPYEN
jgi:hypothetical protein